jgi:DNA-binding MarR family transcriptional regulator
MESSLLSSVIDELLSTLPLIARIARKKISRLSPDFHEDVSPLHHEIMKTLEKEGTMHISEVASRLLIPRPQMTRLIDRLVDLKLAERRIDEADRRTINVTLTDRARKMLKRMDSAVKGNVGEALSSLSDEEMQELLASVTKLREILSRLE